MNAIGIDIGGTKIALGLVDDKGAILESGIIEIKELHSPSDLISAVTPSVKGFMEAGDPVGIGIGSPGPLDIGEGRICNHYTLNKGLYGMKIVDAFRNEFSLPVMLDHDVNTALWAHYCFADLKGSDSLMLTFGTGIGGSVFKQGRFVRGAGGCAPELGHVLIASGGSECYCGLSGCFEALAAGSVFARELREHSLSIDQFYDSYAVREPEAVEIARKYAGYIERGVITLVRSFEPDNVILGGGMMDRFYPVLLDLMDPNFQEKSFVENPFEIRHSSFGNKAGLIGAAGMVLKGDEL